MASRLCRRSSPPAAAGGGYVEYLWDDPAVAGDEETGSPKVGYAVPYTALGEEFILGSGFYPGIRFNGGCGTVLGTAQSWLCVILRSLRSALKCVRPSRDGTGSPPAINLEKAVVRYRLKLSRWLVPSASLNRGCTGILPAASARHREP